MKLIAAILLLTPSLLFGQTVSYYMSGLLRQPDDRTGREYLRITNGLGRIMEIDGSPSISPILTLKVSNGTLTDNGSGVATLTTGGGGGGGTVTSFSSGNLSPLFTTAVATPATTPALSFSAVAQAANLFYAGPVSGAAVAPTFRVIDDDDLPTILTDGIWKSLGGILGRVVIGSGIAFDGTTLSATGSGGTVTSVALTMPAEFSVAGSPIVGAGTFTVTEAVQSANTFYAGPTSGAAAAPNFRAITEQADIQVPILTNVVYGSNVSGIVGTASNALNVTATGIAGRFIRPVQTQPDGTLYASAHFPDNSIYEFDEEFDTGGAGVVTPGRFLWTATTAGNGQVVGASPTDEQTWGFVNFSAGASAAQNFVGLSRIYPGTSGQQGNTLNFVTVSNIQGAFIFKLVTTNQGSTLRIGFGVTAPTLASPANGFWMSYDSKSNNTTFFFECRSNSFSSTANSTVPISTNAWHTCRFWNTNGPGMYFSMDGEAEVFVPSNMPTAMIVSQMVFGNTNNVAASTAQVDRYAFRVTGLTR